MIKALQMWITTPSNIWSCCGYQRTKREYKKNVCTDEQFKRCNSHLSAATMANHHERIPGFVSMGEFSNDKVTRRKQSSWLGFPIQKAMIWDLLLMIMSMQIWKLHTSFWSYNVKAVKLG
jgi:hypothetical protein